MSGGLDQAISQASALCVSDRRALLLKLTARFLDETCGAAERRHLSKVISRIGATLESQAEPVPAEVMPCEERLISLLRAGDREAFIAGFTKLTGIDPVEAERALNGDGGDALARACMKAGIERATYSAIVVLSDPARALEQTEALLALYDTAPTPARITHEAA
jgi:hypothetical protein